MTVNFIHSVLGNTRDMALILVLLSLGLASAKISNTLVSPWASMHQSHGLSPWFQPKFYVFKQ